MGFLAGSNGTTGGPTNRTGDCYKRHQATSNKEENPSAMPSPSSSELLLLYPHFSCYLPQIPYSSQPQFPLIPSIVPQITYILYWNRSLALDLAVHRAGS
uniref:Uncharacterized protein n=1 Tax=Arundo donax TaxID=35708 RepID=A0A0A8Z1H5_ARUDO